jgi:hypothetical protein
VRTAVPWMHAAVFGALWGGLELSVGTVLQLGRVPLRGSLMAVVALLCLITLRRTQPRFGVCLVAGLVAAVLKVLTLGGLLPGPLIGIGLTAVVVELVFAAAGRRAVAAVTAGGVVLALHPIQMLVMTALVAGPETATALISGLASAAEVFAPGASSPAALIAGLVAGWMLLGAGVGGWCWWVSGRVVRRLGAS